MTFDGGTVTAKYTIDYSQAQQAAAQIKALYSGIQQSTASGTALRAPTGGADLAAVYVRQQQAAARLEAQQAQLARARGEDTGAIALNAQAQERLMALLTRENLTFEQSIAVQRQLASVQTQAARASQESASIGQQFAEGLKSGLLGIVGPAALATTALGATKATVDSFVDAFKFKTQLDQTNASIAISLKGIRDSGQTFAEANAFANRYKLTQEETSAAIQASIPILRTSNASLTDVESTLLRLQAKKPEKSIADAARALDELKAGQIVSIVDQFNVSREAANKMKNEIAGGADAIKVLSDYLTSAGYGMETLEIRTKGAAGALNDYKQAQEELKIAQGEFAQGPGVIFLETYTGVVRILTSALTQGKQAQQALNIAIADQPIARGGGGGGSFVLQDDIRQQIALAQRVGAAFDDERQKLGALQLALGTTEGAIQRSAAASAEDAAKKDLQSVANQKVALQVKNAADAFIRLNPNLDASQAFALAAAQGLDPLIARVIALRVEADKTRADLLGAANLANQNAVNANVAANRAFRPSGREGGSDRQSEADAFNQTLVKQNQEQASLLDSEIALASAKKDTARQIDLLRQKQAALNYQNLTPVEKQAQINAIQAQIISLQEANGRKRVSAAASTGLQLQNVEENTQAQIAKAQREGLERLRDQQEDFDVKRARSQEDEDKKIRRLLASGQRAQAAREKEDFAIEQRRAREDFDRERRRTIRNNAEQLGDISGSAERRSGQIEQRAALRGVKPSGGGGAIPHDLAPVPSGAAPAGAQGGPQRVATLAISGTINIDGKAAGQALFPTIEVLMDESLAISLAQIGVPGAGQLSVGGPG